MDALREEHQFAQHMQDMGIKPGMSRTQKRRILQPEFGHAWGRVNPESFINTYGKSAYNEMRRQFGPNFFARKGEGVGMDVLANSFELEERGGYALNASEISESGFAERVMAPHDQFEADARQGGGAFYQAAMNKGVNPDERIPVVDLSGTKPVKITPQEARAAEIHGVELYDIIRERPYPRTVQPQSGGSVAGATGRPLEITIREMLTGVKDADGNAYFQQRERGARGGIRKMDDGRYIVGLFKNKDASTVIHETGHFFLENLREAAGLEHAPQWVKDSWAKLQEQYGFEHGAQSDAWRAAQERFAREFEAYAREGVAPSPELQGAFEQFRAWLTEIYKSVKRLLGRGGELSPEVRDVFDNLLLTAEREAAPPRAERGALARSEYVPDDPFADHAFEHHTPTEEAASLRNDMAAHELDLARLAEEGRISPEHLQELEAMRFEAERVDTQEDISLGLVGCVMEAF
jgi:hypothetical protein